MKNYLSIIFSSVALVIAIVFGVLFLKGGQQSGTAAEASSAETTVENGAIVYVDLDRILQEYDMANDLRSVVETKVQNIQAEVTRKGKKLEKDVNDFQEKMNKGLMTRSVAEVQAQKLDQQQQEFNSYAQQKQNEINEEQMVMMNQLADAIKTYIDSYNTEKQYAMILTNQGGAPVISADASLDITDDVLAGLNEEYVRNKNKK
ncbi:MAG: OmpH family outer membrane protein [Bacteroidales bacterium]|nr:OmpH family outer membrane protein [Bacteroides sp.]MCM1197512.1 OmpH family outer membrane protein [Clostridium sp.]MCM1502205.1 OmpH family outer membrane protein [Bacteroidales bacterium]